MNEKDYARQLLAMMLGSCQIYRQAGGHPVTFYAMTSRFGVEVAINSFFGETELMMSTRSPEVERVATNCWGAAQLLAHGGEDYEDEPLSFVYADELVDA